MELKNNYRRIPDAKERLRIVLLSLQPGVNKSELCRKEGIYIQQLVCWTHDALKGAEERLCPKAKRAKKHDPEKEYLKQE